ncbi:MAG TPA: glycine C-acetyltransferase [Candidatus Paceibacterota bacterium]|nr:glycine C-acetyltransferase [Candidatus Paceibacterota bacterium]
MYPTEDLFKKEIEDIKAAGMYKTEKVILGKQGMEINVEGKKLLNFCGNNYLALAGDDRLKEIAKEGLDKYGFGMGSVRFICGTSEVHKELEAEVSKFFGTEDTILYPSCFDANTGLFETILQEGDAIFSDELNHASIIDGVRLCKAERFRYKNSNLEELEEQLKAAGDRRRKLIVTDGVFSMDGITAKLSQICDLGEKYGALVVSDESHATGVLGERGRGAVEKENVLGRIDLITSTFGKAMGGAGGGFTTGRKEIIEVLRQRSRTSLFTNALAPMIAYTALYVFKNFDTEFKGSRGSLMENVAYFREKMTSLGFTLGGDGTHPITPVMLFEEMLATKMADLLLEKGIYVRGFTYPVVPKGKARIRVQISAGHTREQLEKAIKAFEEAGRELNIIK